MTFYTDVWILTAKGHHLFSVPAAASGVRVGINLLMLRVGVLFRDGRIKQVLLKYKISAILSNQLPYFTFRVCLKEDWIWGTNSTKEGTEHKLY